MMFGAHAKNVRLRITWKEDWDSFESRVWTAIRVAADEQAPVEFQHAGRLLIIDPNEMSRVMADHLDKTQLTQQFPHVEECK